MSAVLTGCGMLAQVKNYPIINDCLAQVRLELFYCVLHFKLLRLYCFISVKLLTQHVVRSGYLLTRKHLPIFESRLFCL